MKRKTAFALDDSMPLIYAVLRNYIKLRGQIKKDWKSEALEKWFGYDFQERVIDQLDSAYHGGETLAKLSFSYEDIISIGLILTLYYEILNDLRKISPEKTMKTIKFLERLLEDNNHEMN